MNEDTELGIWLVLALYCLVGRVYRRYCRAVSCFFFLSVLYGQYWWSGMDVCCSGHCCGQRVLGLFTNNVLQSVLLHWTVHQLGENLLAAHDRQTMPVPVLLWNKAWRRGWGGWGWNLSCSEEESKQFTKTSGCYRLFAQNKCQLCKQKVK